MRIYNPLKPEQVTLGSLKRMNKRGRLDGYYFRYVLNESRIVDIHVLSSFEMSIPTQRTSDEDYFAWIPYTSYWRAQQIPLFPSEQEAIRDLLSQGITVYRFDTFFLLRNFIDKMYSDEWHRISEKLKSHYPHAISLPPFIPKLINTFTKEMIADDSMRYCEKNDAIQGTLDWLVKGGDLIQTGNRVYHLAPFYKEEGDL